MIEELIKKRDEELAERKEKRKKNAEAEVEKKKTDSEDKATAAPTNTVCFSFVLKF